MSVLNSQADNQLRLEVATLLTSHQSDDDYFSNEATAALDHWFAHGYLPEGTSVPVILELSGFSKEQKKADELTVKMLSWLWQQKDFLYSAFTDADVDAEQEKMIWDAFVDFARLSPNEAAALLSDWVVTTGKSAPNVLVKLAALQPSSTGVKRIDDESKHWDKVYHALRFAEDFNLTDDEVKALCRQNQDAAQQMINAAKKLRNRIKYRLGKGFCKVFGMTLPPQKSTVKKCKSALEEIKSELTVSAQKQVSSPSANSASAPAVEPSVPTQNHAPVVTPVSTTSLPQSTPASTTTAQSQGAATPQPRNFSGNLSFNSPGISPVLTPAQKRGVHMSSYGNASALFAEVDDDDLVRLGMPGSDLFSPVEVMNSPETTPVSRQSSARAQHARRSPSSTGPQRKLFSQQQSSAEQDHVDDMFARMAQEHDSMDDSVSISSEDLAVAASGRRSPGASLNDEIEAALIGMTQTSDQSPFATAAELGDVSIDEGGRLEDPIYMPTPPKDAAARIWGGALFSPVRSGSATPAAEQSTNLSGSLSMSSSED